MLCRDGEYNIYVVQFQALTKPGERDFWVNACFYPKELCKTDTDNADLLIQCTEYGECYKETGIIGCFDKDTAVAVCKLCAAHDKRTKFRVALANISQQIIFA